MKKAGLAVLALAVVAGIAGAIYFFRLTAPVATTTGLPVAPTLSVNNTAVAASTVAPAAETAAAANATAIPATNATTASAATTTDATSAASAATAAPATTTEAASEPSSAATTTTRTTAARVFRIDAAQSEASYRVKETFINRDNAIVEAVGVTKAVAGDVLIDMANPAASQVGDIVIDVSQLTSDQDRRDNAIRRQWLESSKYPQATFRNAKISELPSDLREGTPFKFKMTGDMTVHGQTQPATWDVEATLDGDALRGTATTALKMSQFGIDPPDIAGMLRAEDDAALMLKFVANATQ